MHLRLLAFSVGAFSSAFWTLLPAPWVLATGAILTLPLLVAAQRWVRPLPWVVIGALGAACWGHWMLASRLPAALDKTDHEVTGVIAGLPVADDRRARFLLDVETLIPVAGGAPPAPLARLQLSWYGAVPDLQPGQRWRLQVRLREPRGLANPGGFDYHTWLLYQGVSATGYVRAAPTNALLAAAAGMPIDRLRAALRDRIRQLPLTPTARAFVAALTVGDASDLSAASWRDLQTTGTLHLMVVSGQHIALAAGVGMAFGVGLGRLLLMLGVLLPARQLGVGFALATALFYAALAGPSIATQRALLMLAVVLAALLLRRRIQPLTALLWALALIGALDPLAVLAAGFWLSFGAVAALLGYFAPRPRARRGHGLWSAQLVVFVALAGWLVLFQGQVPLLSPLANLVAVPWISFLVVPLCLAGAALAPLSTEVANWCWLIAGRQLQVFDDLLHWFAALNGDWQWQAATAGRPLVVVALLVAGGLLLLPRSLGARLPAAVILAAVALARATDRPPLAVTVLDVGQGLAVVVETATAVLVYDAGPAFSARFDAGSGIVAPYLRHRGWRALDRLVISHNDLDHNGGLVGLLAFYPPRDLLSGQPAAVPATVPATAPARPCVAGDRWRWGEVAFRVLHPPRDFRGADNDHSCVLLIRYRDRAVLLTGDIEAATEAALLNDPALPARVELLIAPHHGSGTSSSAAFVSRLRPRQVVYSAGYRHHFGHPQARVVARYRGVGARQWNTAVSGAVRFTWDAAGAFAVDAQRERRRHYWD